MNTRIGAKNERKYTNVLAKNLTVSMSAARSSGDWIISQLLVDAS
jgi:hypothetical protein